MDLKVWQKAHNFVMEIYGHTKEFPVEEKYSLVSQLRRASVSIPANIAEGFARKHRKEYVQYLYIAQGSLEEAKYYILLSKDLCYLKESAYKKLVDLSEEVGRMLRGLINALS